MFNMKARILSILIALFLTLIGCSFYYHFLSSKDINLFNLSTTGTYSQLSMKRGAELTKGESVSGHFTSIYNNLGIISIRFDNQSHRSNDILEFKLREIGQKDWLYDAEYHTDQFQPHKLFPFGFPLILNSAGKSYEFQIESLVGSTGSGVFIDTQSPIFVISSFFPRKAVLSSLRNITIFLSNKWQNIISDQESVLMWFIYFSPLIFYLIYRVSESFSYHFLSSLTLSLSIVEIFVLRNNSDFFLLSVIFLWGLTVYRFKFESQISSLYAVFYFLLVGYFSLFSLSTISEKAAIWGCLFLTAAMFTKIFGSIFIGHKQMSIVYFLKNVFRIKYDRNMPMGKAFRLLVYSSGLLFCVYQQYVSLTSIVKTRDLFVEFLPLDTSWYGHFVLLFLPSVFYLLLVGAIFYKRLVGRTILIIAVCFSIVLSSATSAFISKVTTFQYIPKVFFISPQDSSEAWFDITIVGVNFLDIPYLGSVTINGVQQRIIYWSNNKIIIRTDPLKTTSGKLIVNTYGGLISNEAKLIYRFK